MIVARSASRRRVHCVKSRIRRDAHSCEAKQGMNCLVSRETHPPRRSSRRTGRVLLGVKLSIEIRRERRLFPLLAGADGKKDPTTEIQLVKSSSNRYLAFCASVVKGASVTMTQPESFSYISKSLVKGVLVVSYGNFQPLLGSMCRLIESIVKHSIPATIDNSQQWHIIHRLQDQLDLNPAPTAS